MPRTTPFRIQKILKHLKTDSPQVLDIGCGSHSPSIFKRYIPKCHYSGVDIDRTYNNDEEDLKNMDVFYEKDLTLLDFKDIPNASFDVIVLSHVIEHLHNGDEVVEKLLEKLRADGLIYIEFPTEKSTRFPSMRETLNFFDDPTHCRIFSIKEIANLLMRNDLRIIEVGKNRRLFSIALMPVKVVYQLLRLGYVKGGVFWDIYGFADYVVARKTN